MMSSEAPPLETIERLSFDATSLMREYPPKLHDRTSGSSSTSRVPTARLVAESSTRAGARRRCRRRWNRTRRFASTRGRTSTTIGRSTARSPRWNGT